jgi:hypothetical protein
LSQYSKRDWQELQQMFRALQGIEGKGRRKLSAEDVLTIHRRLAAGERQVDLAKAYGVSRFCIFDIGRGNS